MFKQFLMAKAIDVVQADGCRLAGLSEAMAVLLLGDEIRPTGVPARRRRRPVRDRAAHLDDRLPVFFGERGTSG